MGEEERTRAFTWEDPTVGTKAAGEMSGLERLRAILRPRHYHGHGL